MFPLTLNKLASMPEGQFYDRKSSRKNPKEVAHHIIGFANSGGGLLAIGIEDDGELTGFQIKDSFPPDSFINTLKTCCENLIKFQTFFINFSYSDDMKDSVLLIKVEPSYNKIYKSVDHEVFIRRNDSTIKLQEDEIEKFQKEKNKVRFEDLIDDNASLKDLDIEIINDYKKILGSNLPIKDFLIANYFLVDEKLTKGAIILFGKNPSQFVPCARLRFLKYKSLNGSENPKEEFNISFKTGLVKLLGEVLTTLKPHFSSFSNSEFWFEDVLTMMAFRDYSYSSEYPRIILYDDLKLFYSPYSKPTHQINQRITHVLNEFGWVQEMNQGIKNYLLIKEQNNE